MVTDGESLYVLNCGAGRDGNVLKVPLSGLSDGGAAVAIDPRSTACGMGITIDSAALYWITTSAIMKFPLDGGASQRVGDYAPTWWVATGNQQHSLTSDADAIYFAVSGSGYVYGHSKTTGVTFTVAADGNASNDGLIGMRGGDLYYTASGAAGEELRVVSKDGGVATRLATLPPSPPSDLLVLNDGVYIAAEYGIVRVPFSGSAVQTVVRANAGLLASDDATLFWSNGWNVDGPHIFLRPLAGGPIENIPSEVASHSAPSTILTTPSLLMWTDLTAGGGLRWMPRSYRP